MWTVGVNCYLHNQWVDGDLPGRATTRAEDAALQVGGVSPALPLDPSSGPQHLRSPAPPRLSPHPPSVPSRGCPCVAGRDHGRVIPSQSEPIAPPHNINVTVPY